MNQPGRIELLEKLIHCWIFAADLRSDPFLKAGELMKEAIAVDSDIPSPRNYRAKLSVIWQCLIEWKKKHSLNAFAYFTYSKILSTPNSYHREAEKREVCQGEKPPETWVIWTAPDPWRLWSCGRNNWRQCESYECGSGRWSDTESRLYHLRWPVTRLWERQPLAQVVD